MELHTESMETRVSTRNQRVCRRDIVEPDYYTKEAENWVETERSGWSVNAGC